MLTYVQELEGTGLTREQASAIARGSALMLDERIDELVTRPHFDTEVGRIDGQFERIDDRFKQVDERFRQVDQRFENVERRLGHLEALVPEVRLHTWMLALLIAALVVPKLQLWFAN